MTAASHETLVVAIFVIVYGGMALGRWPGLRIDRTGVALVGAIVLAIAGRADALLSHVDVATIAILFGMMVLSAQFAAAGLYDWCAARIAASTLPDGVLLALTVAITGALSTLLANDIIVFSIVPLLCRGLGRRGRDPRPFLLAVAGAANAGSAATLIGNPQNILIGQHSGIGFWHFSAVAAPIAAAALAIVYLGIRIVWRGRIGTAVPPSEPVEAVALDRGALAKGVAATALLLVLFATDMLRWHAVLLVAGTLLISRRLSTRDMLALMDWYLLVLIAGLFIVTGALGQTGLLQGAIAGLADLGIHPESLVAIAGLSLVGSNAIGNVPTVVLALAAMPGLGETAAIALAVLSTLAGNLLIVGSLANIIVAQRAAEEGVAITFADHARSGIPIALASVALGSLWLAFLAG